LRKDLLSTVDTQGLGLEAYNNGAVSHPLGDTANQGVPSGLVLTSAGSVVLELRGNVRDPEQRSPVPLVLHYRLAH
jgi:hypothetical protein